MCRPELLATPHWHGSVGRIGFGAVIVYHRRSLKMALAAFRGRWENLLIGRSVLVLSGSFLVTVRRVSILYQVREARVQCYLLADSPILANV